MKITTFNPLIVSPKADEIVKLFEELGFEKRHEIKAGDNDEITSTRMKDAEGNYVDVAKTRNTSRDLTLIRMNVDDFDEAFALLTEKGFKNPRGDKALETKTNKSAMMISPSGFAFDLCQHFK